MSKEYKLKRPYVTEEDLKEARRKGLVVRLRKITAEGAVYDIDGYRVILRR